MPKTYRAVSAFAQGNTRYDKGVILPLTDKQATYLLAGGFIELVPVDAPVALAHDAANDSATGASAPGNDAAGDESSEQPKRNRKGA